MSEARMLHAAVLLPDGRVLVVGGGRPPGEDPVSSAELWDPDTLTFAHAGSLRQARYKPTATLLSDGRVLVTGGGDLDTAFASTELWQATAGS
jgi:hypothetical protein